MGAGEERKKKDAAMPKQEEYRPPCSNHDEFKESCLKDIKAVASECRRRGEKLDAHHERIIRMESKWDDIGKDVKDIKKLLQGNGQPGLIRDMNTIKGTADSAKTQLKIIWFMLLPILGGAITLIVSHIATGTPAP